MAAATAPRTERGNGNESPLGDLLNKDTNWNSRPELMQLKMENEVIMAECRLHPRDFDSIKADILEQLQAFPELATDAIYEKPVGKDNQTGQQKFVRGLSIRAAEALAEAYGYNRIRSDVSEIDADKVKVEATFTDYQKGRVWQDAGILSKTYKDRFGKPARWNDDRFYNVVVKAEVSKRIREVIMRSVNTGLKAWFESKCEEISAGLLDDKTIEKIVAQYQTKSVTVEALETLIGRPRSMGWTQVDRQRLLAIWTAIKDGETTIAEVFADKPAKELPNPTKQAPDVGGKTTDEPDAAYIDSARQRLAACDMLSSLTPLAKELCDGAANDATRTAVDGLCVEAEERVRNSRGSRSNKKQGELV